MFKQLTTSIILILSLLIPSPIYALNMNNEPESPNIEVAPSTSNYEARPLQSLKNFVFKYHGTLNKVTEEAMKTLGPKLDVSMGRIPNLPKITDVYVAEFSDGSVILVAGSGDNLFFATKSTFSGEDAKAAKAEMLIIFNNLILVPVEGA